MSHALIKSLLVFGLILALSAGCAKVTARVRQKPMQGDFLYRTVSVAGALRPIYVDDSNDEFVIFREENPPNKESEGWRVYKWPTMRRVKPVKGSDYPSGRIMPDIVRNPYVSESGVYDKTAWFNLPAKEQDKHRRYEAVKISRWLWGMVDKALTKPTHYDFYKKNSGVWDFLIPELSRNHFFVYQHGNAARGYTPEVKGKSLWGKCMGFFSGKDMNRENEGKLVAMRLTSDVQAPMTMFFRILTLGLFWDSGYSADNEVWGLYNQASAGGWMGKGKYVLVQGRDDMQFRVKAIDFNAEATARAFNDILGDVSRVALGQVGVVRNRNGVPFQDESSQDKQKQLNAEIKRLRQGISQAKPQWAESHKRAAVLKAEFETSLKQLQTIHADPTIGTRIRQLNAWTSAWTHDSGDIPQP